MTPSRPPSHSHITIIFAYNPVQVFQCITNKGGKGNLLSCKIIPASLVIYNDLMGQKGHTLNEFRMYNIQCLTNKLQRIYIPHNWKTNMDIK